MGNHSVFFSHLLKGKMTTVTEEQYQDAVDNDMGWCTICKDFTRECTEPDAENYDCPNCQSHSVIGAELAMIDGEIEVE